MPDNSEEGDLVDTSPNGPKEIETIPDINEPKNEAVKKNGSNTIEPKEKSTLFSSLSEVQLQVLIGIFSGISIISFYFLFAERGIFEVSRFDWLSTNCHEFASSWTLAGTQYYEVAGGDEAYYEIYEQCSDNKFFSLINSLVLIGSVAIAVIALTKLPKTTSNSKIIETVNILGNEPVPSVVLEDKTSLSKTSINSEKPIQKPVNMSPISPMSPIEFDSKGYEWSTDRFERPIFRIAGSTNHWNLWEQ